MTWEAFVLEKIRNGELIKIASSNEWIYEEEVRELAAVLKSPYCKVWYLMLRNTKPGIGGILAMASALQVAPIIHLDMGSILNDHELAALTLSLGSSHCRLMSLSTSINSYSGNGMVALGAALKSPYCKLTRLCLSGNFGARGCEALSDSLRDPNCKLVYLDCNYIPYIEGKGWKIILEAIIDNVDLLYCHIANNVSDISNALKRNLGIFVTTCEAILMGQDAPLKVKERVIRQCQVISGTSEVFDYNISCLAYRTTARLQRMYKELLYHNLVEWLPTAITAIAIQYLEKSREDRLFISFSKGLDHNVTEEEPMRGVNDRDDEAYVMRRRQALEMDQERGDSAACDSDATTVSVENDYEAVEKGAEEGESDGLSDNEQSVDEEHQKTCLQSNSNSQETGAATKELYHFPVLSSHKACHI